MMMMTMMMPILIEKIEYNNYHWKMRIDFDGLIYSLMNLWGFALPSEAFNRAPFNWGRSFGVSFCWTVAGWEADPSDKLCDLLKEYKGWCWKWPAVQSSLLLWEWDVSCRELQYLSGWVREPQNTLVPAGGTSIHPQKPTWNLKITLGKAQSSTNIYNSCLPKKWFQLLTPQKKHSHHLCFDLNRQEGSKT